MFGHQDQTDTNDNQSTSEPMPDATLTTTSDVATPASDPTTSAPAVHTDDTAGSFVMTDPPKHASGPSPATAPSVNLPAVSAGPTSQAAAPSQDDLLDIKQSALQQLTPLLGHLDQTPEEKFRTTMMMIQAADNQALLKTAYEAAQAISDEKVRAQALLDVVNEINYFTQQQETTT